MFIWTCCDINPRFAEYREKVKELSAELKLSESAFALPQHVSLKISFELDEALAKHCMKDIVEHLKTAKPFTAKIAGLELRDGLIWLRMEENEQFKELHAELDEIAKSYAVKPHELDKQFIFHSTVITDENAEKLAAAFEKIKEIPYPDELKINTFLVVYSDDGVSYKVARRIKVK